MANRIEEALQWRERLKRDSSQQTRAAFEQWMLDPQNAREYEQHGKLDAAMFASGARGVEEPLVGKAARRTWMPMAVGAAAVAVATIAVLMARPAANGPTATPPVAVASTSELSRAHLLPDGSVVILSRGATLGAAPDGAARGTTLLSGSARFIVVHNPALPFVVRADGLTVTARGTVFDVDLTGGAARVTLVEGKIDVRRDHAGAPVSKAVVLAPGQVLAASSDQPQPAPAQRAQRVAVIEADKLPLADIVRMANVQGGTPLTLASPELAARVVTGRFDISDSHALGERLATALGLRLIERDGAFVIGAR